MSETVPVQVSKHISISVNLSYNWTFETFRDINWSNNTKNRISKIVYTYLFPRQNFQMSCSVFCPKSELCPDIRSGRTATWGGTCRSTTMSKTSGSLPTTSGSPIYWCTTGRFHCSGPSAPCLVSGDLLVLAGESVSAAAEGRPEPRSKPDTRHHHINLA